MQAITSDKDTLTAKEVAAMLRVTPRTVQNMAMSGALPAFRVGRLWRFNAKDVENLMEATNGKTPASCGSDTVEKRVRSLDDLLGPRTLEEQVRLFEARLNRNRRSRTA